MCYKFFIFKGLILNVKVSFIHFMICLFSALWIDHVPDLKLSYSNQLVTWRSSASLHHIFCALLLFPVFCRQFSILICLSIKRYYPFVGVYAFGLLLMTPQLFLNYRLKSVAHLPWKAMTYKVSIINNLKDPIISKVAVVTGLKSVIPAFSNFFLSI